MVLNVKVILSSNVTNVLKNNFFLWNKYSIFQGFLKPNIHKTSSSFLFSHHASDINECKERTACQCDGCTCKNTWGGYYCKCKGGQLYMKDQDTCIGKTAHLSHYH